MPPKTDSANILGFNCFMHDAAAALLDSKNTIRAVEEERFVRKKHVRRFPENAIRFCLEDAGIEVADLAHVGFYYKPWLGFGSRVFHFLRHLPASREMLKSRGESWFDFKNAPAHFARRFPGGGYRFHFVEHHVAHAASAYYTTGFSDAAVLTIDGAGEWTTTLYSEAKGNKIRPFKRINYPHSLGKVYSAFTQYLGFKPNGGEGKVMGLASYGKPAFIEEFRKIVTSNDCGDFHVDLSYFQDWLGHERRYSDKLVTVFGPPREPESEIDDRHADIAHSLQVILEETALKMAKFLKAAVPSRNLCLAGGVTLNSVMNGKIFEQAGFDEVFVQPAAGDAGTSIGAALFIRHDTLGIEERIPLVNAFLGPRYDETRIRETLERTPGVIFEKVDGIEKKAAALLAQSKIVGWYQGRCEFGPRALGCRSILADPRRAEMKDILNARVKHREGFRPFAPTALAERSGEIFTCGYPSPYMLHVFDVKPDKRDVVPAITHVDGTARVQTVTAAENPLYYALISEFDRLTGVPVVLNTSFNVRGEPIVNTPEEAVACFTATDMDNLAIGDFLVSKK